MLEDLKKIQKELKEDRLVLDLSQRSLFGNEAGEDEKPEILDSYFLEVKNSNDFFNEKEEISVVSGRKGMGKSSLLSRLQYQLIDNNNAERHVRPIALGRKNWLFATSTKGAVSLANWYSIIETAKANGLEPYQYLTYLFTQLPLYERGKMDIEPLLPWNVDLA